MSRGPGRVERAIEAALDAEPDNAFTVEELCRRVYPETAHRAPEKKHRVSKCSRAAQNICKRRSNVEWRLFPSTAADRGPRRTCSGSADVKGQLVPSSTGP